MIFGNKFVYICYMDDVYFVKKEYLLECFNNEVLRLIFVFDKKIGDVFWFCGDMFIIVDIVCYFWVWGWKWSKVNIIFKLCVMEWVDWVCVWFVVECGFVYGMFKDEIDKWSSECK